LTSFEVDLVAEHLNAKRINIMGELLNGVQAKSFAIVVRQNYGYLPLPGNCE